MKMIRCENCGAVGENHAMEPDGLLDFDGSTVCCGAPWTKIDGRRMKVRIAPREEADEFFEALHLSSRDLERMLPMGRD